MGQDVVVVLYYKYVRICDTEDELQAFAATHENLCKSLHLTGRVRLALEGINGTLGGSKNSVQRYIDTMTDDALFSDIDWKVSDSNVTPFLDLQVRVVGEIVALELPATVYDLTQRGTHLTPAEFRNEQLIAKPDSIALIDVRNSYEYQVGHFIGALNPQTRRFGQFPQWIDKHLPLLQEKEKVFMYCTGGIRCEKASAYLKHLGLSHVYQLQGGIHRYLEQYPDGGGLFQGKNFVFDQRVTMECDNHSITGQCATCHQPHDTLSGTRCAYCRMHVLRCDSCRQEATSRGETDADVFCDEHVALIAGSVQELQARVQMLQEKIAQEQGRSKKGRRRSLRKQLDTVESRIQRLTNGPAS